MSRTITKFCSVCKNAGKCEKEYTSHFPKSSNGPDAVVVCPTILNNECSYCHKLGHFKQQCPVLEAKKNGTLLPKEKENKPQNNEKITKINVSSLFTQNKLPENNEKLTKINVNSLFIQKKTESLLQKNKEYIPTQDFIKYLSKYEVGHDWRDDDYWELMESI